MAYFSKFPILSYDINKSGNGKLAIDVLKRIALRENIKTEISYAKEYTIMDGETPDMVSYKFYGKSNLHWIILLLNEITNPYTHWPVSDYSLDTKMSKAYQGKAFYIEDDNLQYEKDMEVWVYGRENSEGIWHIKRNIRGLVKEWDSTTRKLILYNTSGTFLVGDKLSGVNSDGNSVTGKLGRIVDIHKMGLHHFEDNDGNTLNPLATPPDSDGNQILIGQDGKSFLDSILHSYITSNNSDITTHKAVTFEDFERGLNDSKRNIKILRKDLVDVVISDLNGVFK